MSLKGKEEWKDVSLPRNALAGSARSLGVGGDKQEDPTRQSGKGGPLRGRGRTPQEIKGKTREVQGYPSSGGSGSSAGSTGNPGPHQGQGSTSMVSSGLGGGMHMAMAGGSGSRTVTGSWTGQNGVQGQGYHGDERGYERSDAGFQDERSSGYHERVCFSVAAISERYSTDRSDRFALGCPYRSPFTRRTSNRPCTRSTNNEMDSLENATT